MQIIPVIDIRNGIAVRAVAGDRGRYQPLVTRLTASTEPAEILKALQNEFGCNVCYVADLDGIEGRRGNRCSLAEMTRTGVELMVDAGVRSPEDAGQLLELGIDRIIVASETLARIDCLPEFLQVTNERKLVFSIDLKQGLLRSADPAWTDRDAPGLVSAVVSHGISQFIALDLAAVGTGSGIPTLNLCREIKRRWPEVNVVSGGGVGSPACIESARRAGLDGLLLASALHDGRLNAEDL